MADQQEQSLYRTDRQIDLLPTGLVSLSNEVECNTKVATKKSQISWRIVREFTMLLLGRPSSEPIMGPNSTQLPPLPLDLTTLRSVSEHWHKTVEEYSAPKLTKD